MLQYLEIFEGAELIPDWDWRIPVKIKSKLLEILSIEPHTLEEIYAIIGAEKNDAIKYLKILEHESKIVRRWRKGKQYFETEEM